MAPSATELDSRVATGLLDGEGMNPSQLAILKLSSHLRDRDTFSEPDTSGPSAARSHNALLRAGGSGNFSGASRASFGGSKALTARSSCHISSSSRRNSSFIANHRSKMSLELTSQAESKFFALMELMTSANKEASSLKEYWSTLMADRDSFNSEREELLLQIEEISENLERKDDQHHHRDRELGERKREVEKLVSELAIASTTTTEHMKRISERDLDLVSRQYTLLSG